MRTSPLFYDSVGSSKMVDVFAGYFQRFEEDYIPCDGDMVALR